jgi:hypothetical protein
MTPFDCAIPNGYQQLSVTTAASLTVPTGTTIAHIVCTGNAIRWRDDGVDPTTLIGMPLAVNVERVFSTQLQKLRIISQTGTAVVNVAYYK